MKNPHNYRMVGWSMVVVAASLAIIGLIVLSPMGSDPYYSDKILKHKQSEFKEMKQLELQLENKTMIDKKTIQLPDSMFILSKI